MMSALMMGGMSGATDPSGHHRGHQADTPRGWPVPTVKPLGDARRRAALGNPKGGNGGGNQHPNANPNANPNASLERAPEPPERASPERQVGRDDEGGRGEREEADRLRDQKRGRHAFVPRKCTQPKAADALNNRRGYVTKRSNDQLAYIYLEDMEQMGEGASNSFGDFAAQFYPAIRKAGLIIDVRRNAGGNIDTWILERLRRVAWMFNTQRSGPRHHHAIRVPRQSRRVGG